MLTAYFMSPVRGKNGKDVKKEAKWENIKAALFIAGWLEFNFPEIQWYIPHKNEEFVEALIREGVSVHTIVAAFSRIAETKNLGVVYYGNDISDGMLEEIHAMVNADKPLVYFNELSKTAKLHIEQAIKSLTKDLTEEQKKE